MPLVQAPVPAHREPAASGGGQGQLGRADGPGQDRGVQDAQVQGMLGVGRPPRPGARPPAPGLGLAGRGQVDVDPAGEQVLGVPGRLAVAERTRSSRSRRGHGAQRRGSGDEAVAPPRSEPGGRWGGWPSASDNLDTMTTSTCYTGQTADSGRRGDQSAWTRNLTSGTETYRLLTEHSRTERRSETTNGRKQNMAKAVGIDLGTTNSVVSVLEAGEPVVIPNAEGGARPRRSWASPRPARCWWARWPSARPSRTRTGPSAR